MIASLLRAFYMSNFSFICSFFSTSPTYMMRVDTGLLSCFEFGLTSFGRFYSSDACPRKSVFSGWS